MSLLYINSFGQYVQGGASTDLVGDDFVAYSSTWKVTSLETGRGRVRGQSGANGVLYLRLPSTQTTIVLGQRIHVVAAIGGERPVTQFMDDESVMLYWYISTLGQMVIKRGSTTILTSVGSTTYGQDDHWAIKIVFHNTDGEVYLYKNGVLDSSVTAVDTIGSGSSCNGIRWQIQNNSNAMDIAFSDLYVDDATVHGDLKVVYEPFDTAGSNADYTPTGDTTNEDCIDEYEPDDDTTYNVSALDADRDSFTSSIAGDYGASIVGVQIVARARKGDANPGAIKIGVMQGTSEADSGTLTLSTGYKWIWSLFTVDPDTSLAWDPDDMDTMEGFYETVEL